MSIGYITNTYFQAREYETVKEILFDWLQSLQNSEYERNDLLKVVVGRYWWQYRREWGYGPAMFTQAEGLAHPYYWAPFILIGNGF